MDVVVAEDKLRVKFQIEEFHDSKSPQSFLGLRSLMILPLANCLGQYGAGLEFHSLAGIETFAATFEDGSGIPSSFYGREVFALA